jgi:hypothetical protein
MAIDDDFSEEALCEEYGSDFALGPIVGFLMWAKAEGLTISPDMTPSDFLELESRYIASTGTKPFRGFRLDPSRASIKAQMERYWHLPLRPKVSRFADEKVVDLFGGRRPSARP